MRRTAIVISILVAGIASLVLLPGAFGAIRDTVAAMFGGAAKEDVAAEPPASEKPQEQGEPSEVKLTEEQIKLIGLKTEVVEKRRVTVDLGLNGEVTANQDRTVQVLPRAAGVVREVSKTLGDRVHANEPLAIIESRDLAEAVANFFAARSKVELTQKQFERDESLWQKKVSSEQDYLTAKQAATEAAVELRAAEQKLALLGLDPKATSDQPPSNRGAIRVPVLAPFEGSIIEKHIAIGDQVTDQTALFRIANLERVWVIASVFEKDIGNVAVGQTATVTLRAYPERKFEGQITWVSEVIEESTRTLKVRVELDNPDRLLKPGSFARISLRVASKDGAVAVPDSAIQRQKSQPIVFIDAGSGLYKRREVKLGSHSENNVEVTEGIEPGETVVTSGSFLLKSELEKSSFAKSE